MTEEAVKNILADIREMAEINGENASDKEIIISITSRLIITPLFDIRALKSEYMMTHDDLANTETYIPYSQIEYIETL